MLLVLLMVQKSGKLTSRGTRHVTIPWFTKSLGVFKIRIQTVVGYLGFLKQQNSIMIRWFVDVHPTTSLRRWLSRLMIKVNMCFRFFFSRKKTHKIHIIMGPPQCHRPSENMALLGDYQVTMIQWWLVAPLIRPSFLWGVGIGGSP